MRRLAALSGMALTFGVGAALGAVRLRKLYDWRTVWEIAAPVPLVYEALTSRTERVWWPSMELVSDSQGGGLQEGSAVELRVRQASSVRRLAPPFRLRCVYTAVEPERRLRQHVTGDLNGVLEVHLEPQPQDGTRIIWDWYVSVANPLLNLLGFFLETAFHRSHDTVMAEGEQGYAPIVQSYRQKTAGLSSSSKLRTEPDYRVTRPAQARAITSLGSAFP